MVKQSSVTKSNRSGGPRTDEGKRIASQNALKTGAYANTLILPGEDESQFRQIEDQFIKDFHPEDMAEIAMVHDLAVLAWKKIRLENLEQRVVLSRLNAPIDYFEATDTKFLSLPRVESNLHRLAGYTDDLKNETELAINCAKRLQVKNTTIKELEGLEEAHPLIYAMLVKYMKHYGFTNSSAKVLLESEVENNEGKVENFWKYFLRAVIEDLGQLIWFCDNRAQIEQELQAVKDKRLMELMQNEKPSRAFDDLRRNFYRTLSELRKHQEWKRKMQIIDVASRNVADSDEEEGPAS